MHPVASVASFKRVADFLLCRTNLKRKKNERKKRKQNSFRRTFVLIKVTRKHSQPSMFDTKERFNYRRSYAK